MSDNEDLLGDDLGDQSLADYNLGNEEEEQLLADDYDNAAPQNVPSSVGPVFREPIDNMVPQPQEYVAHEYITPPLSYQPVIDTECVVPNIQVEVPSQPVRELPTYAPYEPPVYDEHAVPPAIPAAPVEPPQIVPSDIISPMSNGSMGEMGGRSRFVSERAPGAQRLPQVRDIPDTLDKVVIAGGGGWGRGRTSWRSAQFAARYSQPHPYRRNNMIRGNFNQRVSFPPPQIRPNPQQMRPDMLPERPEMRPEIRPEMRPELRPEMRPDMSPEMRPDMRPEMRPDMRPDMRPENRPDMRPDIRPEMHPDMRPEMRPDIRPDIRPDMPPELRPEQNLPPQMGPEISPERPILPQEMPMFRPPNERPFFPRYQFRPGMDERPPFGLRPHFEPRFYRPGYPPRQFPPPMREIAPNANHMPQVTIRQALPGMPGPNMEKIGPKGEMIREPEVRMLPVPLPANLPPGGLAGKKVLINPHFKGTFQPPVEGLPAYIPTRIQKSPTPLIPPIDNKFGPVKDIDDAAERFIAEQRNALARAAVRKQQARRSPQRYIENTTIEIENELAHTPFRSTADDDLLRRQEEFINANRAGLRRRMRSPSPPRRSPSPPRRSPSPPRRDERERDRNERRNRPDDRHHDEDSEYKRRVREQESLRERVLRAKEVRRRKNAVALHKQLQQREKENQQKEKPEVKPEPVVESTDKLSNEQDSKPDTTRISPEKQKEVTAEVARDRSPVKELPVVNSTVENLTPPHRLPMKQESPERDLTPPLPDKLTDKLTDKRTDSDDDLDLILGDIDGILSDDDDSGRFKDKTKKLEPSSVSKSKPQLDLRSKLPPKSSSTHDSKKLLRQKIVFHEEREEKKKKEKSPPRRAVVTSSTKTDDAEIATETKKTKQTKAKLDAIAKSRLRITYEQKEAEKEADDKKSFSNRRVILQRKATPKEKSVFSRIEVKTDPSKPNPGIFSRAVRTAIGGDNTRIVIKKDEPQVEFESESEGEGSEEESGIVASVANLPHGMTDTRLKTLAGNDVQSLVLDKEDRKAKVTFKTTAAAETFKKKFNNKMVAASRLSVTLR